MVGEDNPLKFTLQSLMVEIPILARKLAGECDGPLASSPQYALVFQASRAQILKQATEYIQFMGKKNGSISQDIDDLKRQNSILDQQGKHGNDS